MRDDFKTVVKEALAKRVGNVCSRPGCGALTSGPHEDASKALNIGVAAHIAAASEGGPRYDPELTQLQRRGPENGIWLCQNCGKLVDNDPEKFSASLLREWKEKAEAAAMESIGKTAAPKVESVVPPLSEKLRAPREPPDPESKAIDLLLKHFQAYMRVVRLIEDIGKLPHNSIVNNPRPPEYDEKKRQLLVKFGEDYLAFQQDFETAVVLLEAARDAAPDPAETESLNAIISAAREVATTVAEMYAWTEDKHNEPVSLGMLHQRPKCCDEAREAAKHMTKLVSARMAARGQR